MGRQNPYEKFERPWLYFDKSLVPWEKSWGGGGGAEWRVGWSHKIANVTVIFQITSWIENEKKKRKNEVNELKKWDRQTSGLKAAKCLKCEGRMVKGMNGLTRILKTGRHDKTD
jgi:hypothetical protein